MTCKGICHRHSVPKHGKDGRYDNNHKRCTRCAVFVKWEGFRCPCCSYLLRCRPRTRKAKAALQRRMDVKTPTVIVVKVRQ